MADQPVRVAVICTGNICRSPMAEVVLAQLIAADPTLRGRVVVTSAGTAQWHVGAQMDKRARDALDRAGFGNPGTPAAFADRAYLNAHDIVVAMTREHMRDVNQRLSNDDTEVILFRNLLQPEQNLDVADPYYGDASEFDDCLELLREGGLCLTLALRRRLGADSSEV
ncbi:MAG: low molecular weight phosphotyrosine protein phosphatase [Acidimicrobiales bacterium]